MIELTLDKTQLKEFHAKLDAINPRKRDGAIAQAFRAVTSETEAYMKEEILSGQVLKPRTGHLRRSIGGVVMQDDKGLLGLVGSGVRQGSRVPYANIHETGGTIRPRNSRYLAIPLPAALTPAGVLRKKPRDWPNTFVMKSSAGNLIIFQRRGKKGMGASIPLFVLKRSVQIPARHYMSLTRDAIAPRMMDIMSRSIERQLEGKAI